MMRIIDLKKHLEGTFHQPTFDKDATLRLAHAMCTIEKEIDKCRYNNRDTQMALDALRILQKIYNYQFKNDDE